MGLEEVKSVLKQARLRDVPSANKGKLREKAREKKKVNLQNSLYTLHKKTKTLSGRNIIWVQTQKEKRGIHKNQMRKERGVGGKTE
jgi:hypothetical protein